MNVVVWRHGCGPPAARVGTELSLPVHVPRRSVPRMLTRTPLRVPWRPVPRMLTRTPLRVPRRPVPRMHGEHGECVVAVREMGLHADQLHRCRLRCRHRYGPELVLNKNVSVD